METILLKAGSFVLIIIAGYVMKRIGLFGPRDFQTIKSLLFNITLPAAVIASFGNFERNISLIFIALFGIGMNAVMVLAGYLTECRRTGRDQAFMMLNLSGYNIGTFATPYLQTFLGAQGILVACIFDCGNAIMCSGLTYAVALGVMGDDEGESGGAMGLLRRLVSSVPFDVYTVMLIMYVLNLKFPDPVYTIAAAFGGANTFLAMFMIGGAIEITLKKEYIKVVGKTLLIRYGMGALMAAGILLFLPYSLEVRQILAILAMAPITSLAVVFSSRARLNEGASAMINSCSILLSLAIMTVLVSVWHLGA